MNCIDTQIVGALLQVFAAIVVAVAVRKTGARDQRVALTIAIDREWNSPEMMRGRTAIERRIKRGASHPSENEDDFAEVWHVVMFVRRVHSLYQAKQLDKVLFEKLIKIDAGPFAARIYRAWKGWGAPRDEWATLSVESI